MERGWLGGAFAGTAARLRTMAIADGITLARLRRAGVNWQLAAALALLAAAAVSRFYNLADDGLRYDEAFAALNSRGTISDVLDRTRFVNSSPIAYPLALWAVQKVETGSVWSVRALPAAASVGTVAVLLFALPRVGVGRRTAFLAALAAALSSVAIEHAQDSREYSVDALLAALTVFGLLKYLRDGKSAVLCAALFAAPLVQYGLILFGCAALATAALYVPPRHSPEDETARRSPAWHWARRRLPLAPPLAFFAAGCALAYATTMRNHLGKDHLRGVYADGLYKGEYGDAVSVLEFAASQTWAALSWHLPDSAAAVGAAAFALALVGMAVRRRFDAAGVAVALSLAIAVLAAVLGRYPLGDARPSVHLGPAIFIGFGFGISWAIDAAAARVRGRGRLSPALFAAAVAGLTAVAADDAAKTKPYAANWNDEAALSMLNERARAGDLVYASRDLAPNMEFYLDEKPPNYFFGTKRCGAPPSDGCVPEIARAAREMGGAGRIWIAASGKIDRLHKDLRNALAAVERVLDGRDGALLFLIENERDLALMTADGDAAANVKRRLAERFAEIAAREPMIDSVFDVYVDGDSLIYAKAPCAADDARGRFYLQTAPVDERDLSDYSRERGLPYDSVNFDFANEGSLFGDKCLIRMRLPRYPLGAVGVGQWSEDGGKSWSGTTRFEASVDAFRDMYAAARETSPAARSVFDVYAMDGGLIYLKEPCVVDDTRGRFYLSAFPTDESDLPKESRERGMAHNPLNFDFAMRGALFDGKCAARAALPDYPLAKVETGQWTPDGGGIWNARILFAGYFDRYRETLKWLSGRTPAVRSVFDVYVDGDSLIYAKETCAADDTRGRFLLSAFPSDAADLTESARKSGRAHNSLNFDFADRGAAFDGKCAIIIALPDYPIREIETGQWLPGEGEIWRARIELR